MRPFAVAWTSARAQRCGFNFDPGKLRGSYLAYEARQSPPDQLAKAERTYDSTYKVIRANAGADPDYCTDSKSAEIKKDLTRHLAGDFKPDLPAPKKQETCGFFGCTEPAAARSLTCRSFGRTRPPRARADRRPCLRQSGGGSRALAMLGRYPARLLSCRLA